MTDADQVLAANGAFYAAFASGDVSAMELLWARAAPVACCHPGWEPLLGRARVIASFRAIFANGVPAVRCGDPSAHLVGDFAYVICTEKLPGGELAATNLFVREEGRYRLVHHHAGPIAREPRPPPPSGALN